MGSRSTDIDDHSTADTIPEDVASLYSWANLQGAKYRDYSGSRRELRAQFRYRAAKAALERELKAQADAEAAAEAAEREVRAAEAMALSDDAAGQSVRAESLRSAERAALKAAAERVEAAKRAESAAHATMVALQEEREIAEARVSAQQQAMMYDEVEMRRRELAGPQPRFRVGSEAGTTPFPMHLTSEPEQVEEQGVSSGADEPVEREAVNYAPSVVSSLQERRGSYLPPDFEPELESASPAWLSTTEFAKVPPAQPIPAAASVEAPRADSLQDYRERVAARWFALKGIFDQSADELPPAPARSPGELQMPLLAVFSIPGGVGKTSLVATLGRSLASAGENVTLVDTTSHGLLPYYYGAREVRPGEMRRFLHRQGSGEPVSMVACDPLSLERHPQDGLPQLILRHGAGKTQRVLVDITSGASWLLRQIVELHPTVLVPIAPEMNSVISLHAIEKLFRGIVDSQGRPLVPFYVLNQFDPAQPLHLDVREVFRRKLGRRLLQFTIRKSASVSEALAEGLTVVDYVPSDPVARDYVDIASWLKEYSPLKSEASSSRWTEK